MSENNFKLSTPIHLLIKEGAKTVFEKSFDTLPIVIGRSLQCEIPLPNYNWISKQHVKVTMENDKLVVIDMKSSNGIKVDGQELRYAFLKDNSMITIGPLTVRLSFQKQAPPEKVKPAADLEQTITYRHTSQTASSPSFKTQYQAPPKAAAEVDGVDMLRLHQPANNIEKLSRQNRVIEAHVIWRGTVYDSRLFRQGETIRIGSTRKGLYLPTLKRDFEIGKFDGAHLTTYIPEKMNGVFRAHGKPEVALQDLLRSQAHPGKNQNYTLKVGPSDLIELDFGHGVQLHMRYAQAPRQLSKKSMVEPDELLQKTMTGSGLVHMAFLFIALFFAPQIHAPKIKNVPPRLAKLLVQPPKVEEPPPPPPPIVEEKKPEPPPPVIAKKEPPIKKELPKKVPPKPKQVVVKVNPVMKKINKLPEPKIVKAPPIEVAQPTPTPPAPVPLPPPPKKVEELGALAALGAISSPSKTVSNQPVAINVNPNAGGQTSMSTTGVIGAIKAKGGKLEAGGLAGVKTTGKGYGTGSGYGVAGLQGQAGSRGIAGAVVGTPSLMRSSKTEGLSQKEVMEIVRKHAGKIQQCYERSLLSNPSLIGRVEYEWYITPKGAVDWAKVKRSDISGADSLNECVSNVFRAMKFPVAKNGESTTPSIGFPFGRQ